jgi:hypothetical protein
MRRFDSVCPVHSCSRFTSTRSMLAKEQVVGDDEATKILQPKPCRDPWKL